MVFCLIPAAYLIRLFIGLIPTSVFLVKAGLKIKGKQQLLKGCGYLFFYGFLSGGAILFMKNSLLRRCSINNIFLLLLLLYPGYIVVEKTIKRVTKIIRKQRNSEKQIWSVILENENFKYEVRALADTGNGLRDPISGKPVSVLNRRIFENNPELKREENFRIIPYCSIGKKRGLLNAYEFQSMTIRGESDDCVLSNVMIAVSPDDMNAGEYEMILHPAHLNNIE